MKLEGQKIGVIGIGLMGFPIAKNLQAAGAEVIVCNRSKESIKALVAEGMVDGKNPANVTKLARTIILLLPDTISVKAVMDGRRGVLKALCSGQLVIDMGTTDVLATRGFASSAIKKNAMYVDAPVSGGVMGAKDGSLSIMVGGTDSAFCVATPILSVLGKHITHIGEVGAGQIAKLANQIIVGLTIQAVAEALTLVKKAGLKPEVVRRAIQGGFADSRVLEVHGKRMIQENFIPGGKSITQLKDLSQAIDLAETLDLQLPATRLELELYKRLVEMGLGELDHSAVVKILE